MRRVLVGVLCGAMTIGCAARELPPSVGPDVRGPLPPGARESFELGLARLAAHDRAGDWTPAACKETVRLLLEGAPSGPAPLYDAGLVEQRCKRDSEARALFQAALAKDPHFYRARAALALQAATQPGGLDGAIADLHRAVVDARFGDAPTLVALATLQMRRGGTTADDDGADDLDRAARNLHRALAIDDGSMPALNQLALLHLEKAKRSARPGTAAKRAGLELAALVCAQAIKKSPRWAPIHNTAGLVEVELGNASRAAAAFDEARRLDPGLVEAQMNLAALNLSVRGFARAEEAYRAALAQRPDDYDARLGLALAIRGQLGGAPDEAERVAAAAKEIAAARRIAPDRPEAYYNEAILVQEYGARGAAKEEALANLARAKGLYEQFLARATAASFAEARERARERMRDIDQIRDVIASAAP